MKMYCLFDKKYVKDANFFKNKTITGTHVK